MVLYEFAHCQEEVGGDGSTIIGGRVGVRALSVVVGQKVSGGITVINWGAQRLMA